jgi:hypothetical protein
MLFKNWLITGLSIALVVSHHLPNSRSSVIMNTKRHYPKLVGSQSVYQSKIYLWLAFLSHVQKSLIYKNLRKAVTIWSWFVEIKLIIYKSIGSRKPKKRVRLYV